MVDLLIRSNNIQGYFCELFLRQVLENKQVDPSGKSLIYFSTLEYYKSQRRIEIFICGKIDVPRFIFSYISKSTISKLNIFKTGIIFSEKYVKIYLQLRFLVPKDH